MRQIPPTLTLKTDHRLLSWQTAFVRSCPVYSEVTRRSWCRLDSDVFRASLRSSPLCNEEAWSTLGVDDWARLYDDQTTQVLNDLFRSRPLRVVVDRRTPGSTRSANR